jgi:hypothetical protein
MRIDDVVKEKTDEGKSRGTILLRDLPFIPGKGGSDGVGLADLLVDQGIEDGQEEEGDQVEEDQVQPVDVHLQQINKSKSYFPISL